MRVKIYELQPGPAGFELDKDRLLCIIDIQDHQTHLLWRVGCQLEEFGSRVSQIAEGRFPFLGLRRHDGYLCFYDCSS